ncbi:hypothetical protein ABZY93_22075 [Streptomyces smyrnaeus]|uniref:phage tail protein n=1 Tax=Streptomyces smyrnaeus TaxID=1387713 RepID=UPI0033BA5DC9
MPGGQVIGRVSVKVLPDTDDFRRSAQNDLDKIEKTLKVEIGTKIDMSGASREMLSAIQTINQRNRQADSRKIRFHTMIAKSTMNEAISRAVRQLNEKARNQKVRIDADLVGVDVKAELDRESLDKVKRDIDDWKRDNSPVRIDIELNWPAGAGTAVNARLAVLTRPRTVTIIPRLDKTAVARLTTALAALSGARVLSNVFEKISNSLKNLDRNVPIIGTLATAIAGLGAWGLTAASNLFTLSASLASIAPLALLLPGLFGGLAVGIGATIAVFKDFNKVIPGVDKALSKIQDRMSAKFWAQAKAPIQEMISTLLPQFGAGLVKTSTALGGFFGSLAEDLQGKLSPVLNQMFADLNSSIKIATGSTGGLANIIAVLGQVGTSHLPGLAGWVTEITNRFSKFLTKAASDGSLDKWIAEALQALKDLGRVLYNLGGIFAGIARAAEQAGGSSLGMMADTLERVHRVVDSRAFQTGLVTVLTAAHQAMSHIAQISGPAVKNFFSSFTSLLGSILPQVGRILGTALKAVANALAQPEVSEGIRAMFDGLLKAVQGLAPAMAPLGRALGVVAQLVGALAAQLGPLIAAALIPAAKAFEALAPSIIPIINLLGGTLTEAVKMVGKAMQPLIPVVKDALGQAFQALSVILPVIAELFGKILATTAPLVAQLGQALAPILPVLAAAISQIFQALMPLVDIALKIITAVITPLLPMLSQLIQEVLPPLADAIQRQMEAMKPLLQALLKLVQFLMPVLVPVLEFIIKLLADSLVAAVNGVALTFEGLVEIVRGVWDIIVGVLKIAWGLIEGIFTGNFSTLKSGWSQFWNGIWSFVKGIWDTILGAFSVFLNIGLVGAAGKALRAIGALFRSGWQAVFNFGQSAWRAMTSAFSSFGSGLASLGRSMMNSVGRWISDGWQAVRSATSDALRRLISSLGGWVRDAANKVGELAGRAKSALGNLGHTLWNAGRDLIQGFINGLTSMFNKVKDKLRSLTDSLPDWKGPRTLDRVILVDAGQLVMDGFIRGLESRYDAVRDSLKGLTDDVSGTVIDPPSIGQIASSRGLTSSLTAALEGASGSGATKVFNYYAAPGSSLGSEEDLFAATSRARFGW